MKNIFGGVASQLLIVSALRLCVERLFFNAKTPGRKDAKEEWRCALARFSSFDNIPNPAKLAA
jgi:hypothetical protein